jgi:ATP-dependent DNA helicase PIF1
MPYFGKLPTPARPSRWPAALRERMDPMVSPENVFLALAHGGRNVFLTGMAGTGKSYLLRQFISEAASGIRGGDLNLGADQVAVDVTAPTGVAALNVGGMTLHRFCGMLLGPGLGETNEEYFAKLELDRRPSVRAGFNRVRRCRVLVIDEVSMLSGRHFAFVEYLFRQLRGRDEPWGGVQVIAIGDFLQLPPVRTDETVPYDWTFGTEAWAATGFRNVVLETVRRQDEPEFVAALGDFRRGRVRGDGARLLMGRVKTFPPSNIVRVLTHNLAVDKWNNFQLAELEGVERRFDAVQEGNEFSCKFLANNLLTPSALRLKVGALVMFTVNRAVGPQRDTVYVNGELGVVESFALDGIMVRKNGGDLVCVTPFQWSYGEGELVGTFKQVPLRLAYAMTIHKSQGITLDAAFVDIRAAREPGQAYVALSRVRTLGGLLLKDWIRGVAVSNDALNFYRGLAE